MRLHRFYITGKNMAVHKPSDRVTVEDTALIHQWRDVFRYTVGGQVLLFDDSKAEYLAMIESIDDRKATLVLLEQKASEKKKTKEKGIWLVAAMLKGENFDWVVEKTTEIGVSYIVPCITERTVKTGLNLDRLKKIATEAAEQSGRRDVPGVSDITRLQNAITNFKTSTNGLIFVCNEGGKKVGDIQKEITKAKAKKINTGSIAILIGPEGGWSPNEIKFFKESKFTFISLGKNVLRAETAAVVGMYAFSR